MPVPKKSTEYTAEERENFPRIFQLKEDHVVSCLLRCSKILKIFLFRPIGMSQWKLRTGVLLLLRRLIFLSFDF